MDIFFNELSIKTAPERLTAMKWMDILIQVYKKALERGFKELKTTEAFMNIALAPGYTLIDWMHDRTIDADTRLLFKTKVSKSPYIEKLISGEENGKHQLHEFKYQNRHAAGLGAAYLFDSLAISFDSSSQWDHHLIFLDVTAYSEDEQIVHSVEEVNHSSKPQHIDLLNEWLEEKKKRSIPNGRLLWLKRKIHFPHLVFCREVEKQVSFFSGREPEFHAIVKRLFELESYCSTWLEGKFTGECLPSKVTPESESRRLKFKKELTILCPDGEYREFSWHSRYTPGTGRLHFAPDNPSKTIYIGYIGKKIQ